MEKRKQIGLKGYFTRSLLRFFIIVLFILFLSIVLFEILMQAGFIAPANTGEAEAGTEIYRQSETGSFTGDLEPQFYEYIFFDEEGAVQESSLTGRKLTRMLARYEDKAEHYTTGEYVLFADGSSCLFIWSYTAAFTNTALRNMIPSAEIIWITLTGAVLILFFFLFIRRMGRNLGDPLVLVEAASSQIAQQDLDTPIVTTVGIQEFNQALESMEEMRAALKSALTWQWESQQQRKEEIAALTHDIKTPLTVINGNAELLMEDSLNDEQVRLVKAIHSAGMRAKQYVEALQQISNLEISSERAELLSIDALMKDLHTALAPLAESKAITLAYDYGDNMNCIHVYPSILLRALVNIGENAIRFTKPEGHIKISAFQNGAETIISIEDEGPGFSQAALSHAREIFWQQEHSRSSDSHYGMGLAIAEKVAQKHSGSLLLENTANGGCVKLVIMNV